MKKILYTFTACLLIICFFTSCAPSLSSIDVEQKDVTMNKGDTLLINVNKTYSVEDVTEDQASKAIDAASITWVSSDESIVAVDNGTLTAIDAGTAEITVTAKCAKETISVTVIIPLEDILVTPDALELVINGNEGEDAADLIVELSPADATDPPQINYTSVDETVATVDNAGHVTAIGDGETEITVMCGEVVKTVAVTVTTKPSTTNTSYSSGGGSTGYRGSSNGASGSVSSGSVNSSGNNGSGEYYIPDEDFEIVDMGTWCSGCGGRWDTVNNTCPYCDGTVDAPLR